ncbi:hypothetical protein [Winogradskyella alexanderae]|uniref:DUF2764 family protein n=1 Tax=Winogradskyella alexanderae TaxID=2877123 RepID=A0ABS7XQA9_9FLAO|nr:hypothetical protein [Winogradskyella alexanderae]MCA0132196.1 hypothetical protein [Winogradskyella alexanderae]
MLTGNLEYLISSLPNLTFSYSDTVKLEIRGLFQKYASNEEDSQDLVSILHDDASKYLSPSEFNRFKTIELKSIHLPNFRDSSVDVVAKFSKFMHHLKSELKDYRINRKSIESTGKLHYEILGELPENPLKAEEYLLGLQWQKLETLSLGHYANFSALTLYKLKLEVLLRWWQFDAEVGFEVFQQSLKVA